MFQKLVFLVPVWVMLGLQDTIFSTSYTVAGTLRVRHPTHFHKSVLPYAPNGDDETIYKKNPTTSCKVPEVVKTITISTPITVKAGQTFDCKYNKYQRDDHSCNLNVEKGHEAAIFILEEGASLRRCLLGYSQEGLYCMGGCDIIDCHWTQMCDEAITLKQTSGKSLVSQSSFSNGGNKVIQSDGGGSVTVEDSCFSNVDIVYRSCGGSGCTNQKRDVVFNNIQLEGVNTLAGFNGKNGDTVNVVSYSGTAAKTMCEDKEAGTTTGVPPGCTIS
ncbi:hypothetical protein CROQUDRAFT_719364 [Cronartium quercuum f. sp. fusiforme G11]|uniref:Pectate lyase n=1 Tax=Cronartium quercuum f. sp. fusiforme G11 TaxID=708437 RepID=A0A9P6TGS1_9BASI|nr:hypothetical protein CROQUDRAFT_719364 [Cronartium quercuum f. sp. fusiforme G11]